MGDKKLWMQHSLAVIILLIFAAALGVSFIAEDKTLLTAMLGSTVPMASTVIQFYFGSSSGSREKDVTIAAQQRNNGSDQPVAIAVSGTQPDQETVVSAPATTRSASSVPLATPAAAVR